MARIIRRDTGQPGSARAGAGAPEARIRYVTRARTTSFDHYVRQLVEQRGFGHEWTYFGLETEDRAREVRRGLRRGATHLGVSLRAFWEPCRGCKLGGPSCRYHVHFTAFHPEEARTHAAKHRPGAGRRPIAKRGET